MRTNNIAVVTYINRLGATVPLPAPSSPVVLKVGGANTLQGGRDVTDGERKKKTPPTCHWLVKAPSVAKCKGLD